MPVPILVVEDDLLMREEIVESLGDEGYEPYGAASCKEALSLAEQHQFKVLVTDVRLPGIDGIDGLVELKKKQPNLRSLVITGFAGEDGVKKAFANEVDDYLRKPFSVDALLAAVDRLAYPNKLLKYYDTLLQSTPIKGLFSVAASFFRKNDAAKVDHTRERAFWGLLMAIRSDEIDANTANFIFCSLGKADEQYREFYERPSKENSQSLISQYSDIYQNLASLVNSKMVKIGGERMPPLEFRGLYNAVQRGGITLEEFQMAPVLKGIEPEKLLTAPELAQLREKLWGLAS
jgi:CheY-like chemotaxis protein